MKIPVDEAPAGPETDAAVAEALGWLPYESDGVWYWKDMSNDDFPYYDYHAGGYGYVEDIKPWSPSTDIAAAWELLPRMQSAYGILLGILYNVTECKTMKDDKPIIGRAEGQGAKQTAHAICRAFLKANGVECVEMLE